MMPLLSIRIRTISSIALDVHQRWLQDSELNDNNNAREPATVYGKHKRCYILELKGGRITNVRNLYEHNEIFFLSSESIISRSKDLYKCAYAIAKEIRSVIITSTYKEPGRSLH